MHTKTKSVLTTALAVAALVLTAGCKEENRAADDHGVYFVGYVYDGARGTRLKAADITAISIRYRDKVINTTIEPDGRFVSAEPLPTWQDYAVYIGAPGYRPFVSANPGIDVPSSLSMTDGLAGASTTQTLHFDAHLFPASIQTPKVVLTVEKADAFTTMPMPARASGTLRLRPVSSSLLEQASGGLGAPSRHRRWANDEDLLTQTVTKVFSEGKAEVAEGELVYGVAYEIAVYDVKGYQPIVEAERLIAGQVTSRTLSLPKELRDRLRVLSTNIETCSPPAGTATAPGAEIRIVFNEAVELVGMGWAEAIDNGVSITPAGPSAGTSYCGLRQNTDPATQERGTKVTIDGSTLVLTFNPSVGLATGTSVSFPCTVPPALSSVTYGNLVALELRPVGDSTRKRSLAAMLQEPSGTAPGVPSSGGNSITCGVRPPSSF
jgi:hypothetical protein